MSINGDQLDNRRCNLRIVTLQQNGWNRHKIGKLNTSGHNGVGFDKRLGVWKARIGFNGKAIHLGTFLTVEEAAAARRAAELKYYGEFAPQSTP